MLYGCDLLLDTDEEERAKLGEKWLQNLDNRSKKLDEIETMEEMRDFTLINKPL